MRNQLTRWGKNGLIIQLKRGVYMLNKNDQKLHPSRFYLANQLLWPSYVSLESALGYYGLIPEAVADVVTPTLAAAGYRVQVTTLARDPHSSCCA